MRYRRGDVVLVLFPHSDLLHVKRRPALVVQADNLDTGLDQLIIAMITTNLKRADHPSRYLIRLNTPEGRASGLLSDSVVMTDNLTTVFIQAIVDRLGHLPNMRPINEALRVTLGL